MNFFLKLRVTFFCEECLFFSKYFLEVLMEPYRVYVGCENTEMTMISSGVTELPVYQDPYGI